METITLEKIYARLLQLGRDVEQMKAWLREDFQLSDEVVYEIELSRKRPKKDFITHEEMRKEFG